jgi:hypothetical protein
VTSSEHLKPQCGESSKFGKVMLGVPGSRIIEIEALRETTNNDDETENANPTKIDQHERDKNVLHFILCRSWEF